MGYNLLLRLLILLYISIFNTHSSNPEISASHIVDCQKQQGSSLNCGFQFQCTFEEGFECEFSHNNRLPGAHAFLIALSCHLLLDFFAAKAIDDFLLCFLCSGRRREQLLMIAISKFLSMADCPYVDGVLAVGAGAVEHGEALAEGDAEDVHIDDI